MIPNYRLSVGSILLAAQKKTMATPKGIVPRMKSIKLSNRRGFIDRFISLCQPLVKASVLTFLLALAWLAPAFAQVSRHEIGSVSGTANSSGNFTFSLPINTQCTASNAPYTCCTGTGTGTCALTNDDLVIYCIMAAQVAEAPPAPTGGGTYTLIPNTGQIGSIDSSACYSHLWLTGDGTGLTGNVGASATDVFAWVVGTYSGANASTPIDASTGQINSSSSTAIGLPVVSPVGSADYWIGVGFQQNATNANFTASSLGSISIVSPAASNALTMGFAEDQLSSSGSTGPQTITSNASHSSQGAAITVKPASAATATATATATPTATATATATAAPGVSSGGIGRGPDGLISSGAEAR